MDHPCFFAKVPRKMHEGAGECEVHFEGDVLACPSMSQQAIQVKAHTAEQYSE